MQAVAPNLSTPWRFRRGSINSQGRVVSFLGEVPRVDGPDPRRGEGSVPSPEEEGQYTQIRPHLPQYLPRPRREEEQGPGLALPREQVRHGVAHRRLRRRADGQVWYLDARTGRGAAQVLRQRRDAAAQRRRHAGGRRTAARGTRRGRRDGRGVFCEEGQEEEEAQGGVGRRRAHQGQEEEEEEVLCLRL